MGEISKDLRVTLLILSGAFLTFAILYLFFTDFYFGFIEWPYEDPYYSRAFGITLLILAIFGLIVYYRKDWNQAKIYIEIVLVWSFLIVVANFIELAVLPLTIEAVATTWADTIILMVLIGTTLYFYIKEKQLT